MVNSCFTVGVIGAGGAGLQQGRALQKRHIEFTIYEQSDKVGGVWRQCTHLQGAQAPWEWYEFPEYPYPPALKQQYADAITPPAPAVQQYIEMYAEHFNLLDNIRFRTSVTQLRPPDGQGRQWVMVSKSDQGHMTETIHDFIVIATGFAFVPRLPFIKGRDMFLGTEMVARNLTTDNLHVARGKQVVVIGSAKSAVDAAGAAAEVADSVVMLSRKAHYFMPLRMFNWIPVEYPFFSRIAMALCTHPYPYCDRMFRQPTLLTQSLRTLARPLQLLNWWLLSKIVPWHSRLPPQMHPDRGMEEDIFGQAGTIHAGSVFLKHLQPGKIKIIRGEAERFEAGGIVTKDGTFIPADLVIYATGFERPHQYLPAGVLAALGRTKEGIPLYRDTLPTQVEGLAFVGAEVLSFNALVTTGLQAEWVAAVLQGEVKLPSRANQEADVGKKQRWRRSFMPAHNLRSGTLGAVHIGLWDEFMYDMGRPQHRKGWTWLREFWEPMTGRDYKDVFDCAAHP